MVDTTPAGRLQQEARVGVDGAASVGAIKQQKQRVLQAKLDEL